MRAYSRVGQGVAVPLLPSSWQSCPVREPDPAVAPGTAAAHEVGARVRILGLGNATHLNGRGGYVTRADGEVGVVYVQLDAQAGNDDRTSPPMKLLAKFVEPITCTPDADEDDAEAVTCGLPTCILHEPAGDDGAAAKRHAQMQMEALHAAQQALQTASDCLLGKPWASSWALDGCDASIDGTRSKGTSSSGRGRTLHQELPRRTWCKADMDMEVYIDCNGAKIQGVDGAVRVLDEHRQALQVLKDSPDRVEEALDGAAQTLLAVAGALQTAGRLEEALEVASGVMPIARRTGGGLVEAKASLIMGWSKCRAGRYVEARHHARQAGLLFLHNHDQCGQVDAALVLGECNHRICRYTEASKSFLFALVGARQMADRVRQVDILAKLSQVLAEMGHTCSASEHAQQALALSEEEAHYASVTVATAAVFARAGDHEQATLKAQEQLDVCVRSSSYDQNKQRVNALCIKGWALLALKNATLAEETFLQQQQAAVGLGDVVGEASALQGLSAALVALRQYDLALDILRQEEVLWDCMGDFMRRRMCLDRICKMLEKLKQRNEAMVIRRREGVSVHPLAPLFSNEDYKQSHFDEDRVIKNPRLCHNERRASPWTLPVLPSQYLMWGNRFHLSSSTGRRVTLNFPAGYIKNDFEPIRKIEPEPLPTAPQPRKILSLV